MFYNNFYLNQISKKISKYINKYTNNPKIIACKLIFWNFKFLFKSHKNKPKYNDNFQHIAIELRGGIGDIVINAQYIKALFNYLDPNTKIDILCEETTIAITKEIFNNESWINQVILINNDLYDAYIYLVRFPYIQYYFDYRLSSKTNDYINEILKFHSENPLCFKNDFFGKCYMHLKGKTRETEADITNLFAGNNNLDYSLNCYSNQQETENKFNLTNNKYIVVHTGSGLSFSDITNESRQWPLNYYNELVSLIKEKFPKYKIIQIGEKRQPTITNVDLNLQDKTTFRELLTLLKYSSLLISQEGGIPILRHFLNGGKSIVLFGPTDEKFFGFKENINLSQRTCPIACEWISQDWMKKCFYCGESSICMKAITPQYVMKFINL